MTTTPTYTKPLPQPYDEYSKRFWSGVHKHEIWMQKCPTCAYVRYPFARMCPECLEVNDEWVQLSGKGKVWSFGVYHHLFNPAFKGDIPYNIALVELEEGPLFMTNLVGIDNDAIEVGMALEPYFDDVTPDFTLLKFQPAQNTGE